MKRCDEDMHMKLVRRGVVMIVLAYAAGLIALVFPSDIVLMALCFSSLGAGAAFLVAADIVTGR